MLEKNWSKDNKKPRVASLQGRLEFLQPIKKPHVVSRDNQCKHLKKWSLHFCVELKQPTMVLQANKAKHLQKWSFHLCIELDHVSNVKIYICIMFTCVKCIKCMAVELFPTFMGLVTPSL